MRPFYKHKGATLVELLIGLAISGTLLTAMLALMSQQTAHLNKLSGQYAFLSNLRFAVHWINNDIQRMGFLGCTPINSPKIDNQSLQLAPLKFVQYEEEDSNGRLNLVTGEYRPDIKIRSIGPTHPELITIEASPHPNWTAGRILAITDCQKASLFAISHFDKHIGAIFHETFQRRSNKGSLAKKINRKTQLKWRFTADTPGMQLIEMEPVTYSIKQGENGSGLYRNDIEIMPDIYSFRVHFQIDSNCDGITDMISSQPPPDLTKLSAIAIQLQHKQKFFQDEGVFMQRFPVTRRCLV